MGHLLDKLYSTMVANSEEQQQPYIGELQQQQQQNDHSDGGAQDSEDDEEDLDAQEDGTWEDWVEDEDDDGQQSRQPTHSLFDDKIILDGPEQALQHDKEKYGVDIISVVARLGDLTGALATDSREYTEAIVTGRPRFSPNHQTNHLHSDHRTLTHHHLPLSSFV
jgi:hypothetical protein